MTVHQVLELAARADEVFGRPGLTGWGLCVGGELADFGHVVDLGPEHGCADPRCAHASHDAAAPDRKWVPPDGWRLVVVYEGAYVLAAVVGPDRVDAGHREVRWVKLAQEDFAHHAYVERVDNVPEWALVRLAGRLRTEGLV